MKSSRQRTPKKQKRQDKKFDRAASGGRLSMHPLSPEQALGPFMRVPGSKVLAAEKRAKKKKGS